MPFAAETTRKPMTFAELEKAITRAHRNGDSRLAYELESEKHFRIVSYRDRKETEAIRQPDNSRRSFKG